jgi:hypothetical protein
VARKKAKKEWYIVTVEETIQRKYLGEATSAREARKSGCEFLGTVDSGDNPEKFVRAVGFPTEQEARESHAAWVDWGA